MKTIFDFKIFFIVFLLAACCKKDEQKEYIPLDSDFLAYFAFPVGSWWVYEEINTSEKDSTYVFNYKIEIAEDDKTGPEIYDFQGLTLHEVIRTDKFYAWARPRWIGETIDEIQYEFTQNYYYLGQNYSTESLIKFKNQKIDSCGIDEYKIYFNYLDSIIINNIIYKDIIIFTHAYQRYHNPFKSIYYCKNIGVIKREYFDGKVYELTNYYLNNK